MLAIGRALMTNPRLLILDEATEGLAPLVRAEIWRCLERLKARGQSILLIDKNVEALTRLADHHYVLEKGRVVWSGTSAELRARAPTSSIDTLGVYDRAMSWIDPNFPKTATVSAAGRARAGPQSRDDDRARDEHVPVGRRDPILLDTGAGVPEYMTGSCRAISPSAAGRSPRAWSSRTATAITWAAWPTCASASAACPSAR